MTSDTCGLTSARPFASYDPESRCWRTSEATSLWALTLSSLTLPSWGCLHGGELSELPTPEPPTAGRGCSSLSLPTPTARDYKEQTLGWTWERDGVTQEDTLPRALTALLPTPKAGDGERGRDLPRLREDEKSRELATAVGPLLPTPTVMDMGANYTPEEWEAWKAKQRAAHANGNGHGESLTQAALSTGASTPPQSPAGSASSDAPHQPPPSPDATDDHDSTLFSWNG